MNLHTIFINTFLNTVNQPYYSVSNQKLKDIFYELINYDGDRNDFQLYWTLRNFWINEGILEKGRGLGGSIGFNPDLTYEEILIKIKNLPD